jgi:autotransporter-associated beta strand protein
MKLFSRRSTPAAAIALLYAFAVSSDALATDVTWVGLGANNRYATALNWSSGVVPASTSTSDVIFIGDNGTLYRTIDTSAFSPGLRNVASIKFNAAAGANGFTFIANLVTTHVGFGFQIGAGGIVNNDADVQTFDVPVRIFANQTWNAASGGITVSGNFANGAGNPMLNNTTAGGFTLTIDGAQNTILGNAGQRGNITGLIGITKNGAGTLTLGGTVANTFTGVNKLNAGKIVAGKVNALGSGNALVASGGTFDTGGLNQTLGTLDLDGSLTLDLSAGASAVSFANSSALDWGTFSLNIVNWTVGSDTLRFGTDGTGLSTGQLALINFSDLGGLQGQIDANGYVTPAPIPEPGTATLLLFGFAGLFIWRRTAR